MSWIDKENMGMRPFFSLLFFRSSRIAIFQRERDRSYVLYFFVLVRKLTTDMLILYICIN